ncbi:TatD family hydrolase [Thiomicrospira sp. WB1]|uniref:TatD family hydrolase n=1 Tax=Thiomicrospira sp. WB1 TaxID=1685380 RepID=UPI00074A6587|nr:TatD family hydrolase [Thiomicrospira sp. WB1]KUJ71108.1 hypothetical protein AVO41_09565 [Thiomicrospira sp. WB1]
MIFDTHAHLAWCVVPKSTDTKTFAPSLPAQAYLAVSTTLKDSLETLHLAQFTQNIVPAIGVHPWFIEHESDSLEVVMSYLANLLQTHPYATIGEIGLDKSIVDRQPLSMQMDWFERQLALAVHYDRPVSLHCFKAWNEMLRLFKSSEFSGVRGIMHGFSGGAEMAKQFVDEGFLIGVGPTYLNPNARRYHQIVEAIGLDSLVIESDAQPDSDDPKCSEQLGKVSQLIDCMAQHLSMPVSRLKAHLWQNSRRLFMKVSKDG